MAVLTLGVSHRRASVELLERIAFGEDDLTKAYRRALDDPAIDEAVILSTCNRIEITGSVPNYHAGFQALKRLLHESRDLSEDELAEPLYAHYELDAAEHAFAVASGLDSMVLGEPQILSQVREALRRAEAEGAARRALTGLFHAAARTGRRVRTETGVGAAPDAFIAAGADLAEESLGGLGGTRGLVVGAGQMSALAVKHLRERGVATVRILNRSLERARALAERTGSEHGGLDELPEAIVGAELVISATGAAGAVVPVSAFERVSRPLFVLDLAVPRDVERGVGDLDRVTLVDIEGLKASLSVRAVEAAADIERAHAIVAEEVERFSLRRRSERLAPLIHALRGRGETVIAGELERFRRELASLTPDERDAVVALARGIVAKLLHEPIVRLKELTAPGSQDAHAKLLAELFDVDPSE